MLSLLYATWTLIDASPRPAAMLLREKLGTEMMFTAPATHPVEAFTNVIVPLCYLDIDRHLPQASCHAAEGEVEG
jgi:hypothetical protein